MLFTCNRGSDEYVSLVIDETLDVVAARETVGTGVVLVLEETLLELGRYPDVEVFEAACEYVDVSEFVHIGLWHFLRGEEIQGSLHCASLRSR